MVGQAEHNQQEEQEAQLQRQQVNQPAMEMPEPHWQEEIRIALQDALLLIMVEIWISRVQVVAMVMEVQEELAIMEEAQQEVFTHMLVAAAAAVPVMLMFGPMQILVKL